MRVCECGRVAVDVLDSVETLSKQYIPCMPQRGQQY